MNKKNVGNAFRRWGKRLVFVAAVCLLGTVVLQAALGKPNPALFSTEVVLEGDELRAALSSPVAGMYMPYFRLQEAWSSCAPASVRNVLASLGRHVEDESDLFVDDWIGQARMLVMGMPLEQAATLFPGQAVEDVTVLRDMDYATFLEHMERSNDPGWRYIVNFDRKPLFGVSIGHFSPLGGYDAVSGKVLLLDVTPGYGMSIAPAALLFAAMNTPDSQTGLNRGLIAVKVKSEL